MQRSQRAVISVSQTFNVKILDLERKKTMRDAGPYDARTSSNQAFQRNT